MGLGEIVLLYVILSADTWKYHAILISRCDFEIWSDQFNNQINIDSQIWMKTGLMLYLSLCLQID